MPFDDATYRPTKYQDHVAALDHMLTNLSRPRGWGKDSFNNQVGGHCLVGAVLASPATDVVKNEIIVRLADLAGVAGEVALERWNDTSRRRKPHVLALVEKARLSYGE